MAELSRSPLKDSMCLRAFGGKLGEVGKMLLKNTGAALHPAARGLLRRLGFTSPDSVRAAIVQGRLYPKCCRGMGDRRFAEIQAWADGRVSAESGSHGAHASAPCEATPGTDRDFALELERLAATNPSAAAVFDAFKAVGMARLEPCLRAKGWEDPKWLAALLDMQSARSTYFPVTTRAKVQELDLAAWIVAIPLRRDVLLGAELTAQLAIIRTHRGKKATPVVRAAIQKLCRHYVAAHDPEAAYRFYRKSRQIASKLSDATEREVLALAGLLTERKRRTIDTQVANDWASA